MPVAHQSAHFAGITLASSPPMQGAHGVVAVQTLAGRRAHLIRIAYLRYRLKMTTVK